MKKLFSDIIREVAELLNSNGSISLIEEDEGTYTVTSVTSIEGLEVGKAVVLLNTDEFEDSYIVTALDLNANTFNFIADTGKQTVVIGTWLSEIPYYDNGTWLELLKRLKAKNNSAVNQLRKFPYIYLIEDYRSKTVNSRLDEIVDIRIYFVNRSDINTYTSDKIQNTLPEIRSIKDNFVFWLNVNSSIVGDIITETDELPFKETFLKGDELTEMIEIKINSIQIDTQIINCS